MLALLPDCERLVSRFLREHLDVAALVGERVYTAFPAQEGDEPLVLVQRTGGFPPFSQPLVLDEALLQLDCYGGPKALAHELAATVRAALCELEGAVRAEGSVTGVTFGALRWLPDPTWKPPRPRYIADVTIYTRPAVVPAAA
jgi:hypothetical protein